MKSDDLSENPIDTIAFEWVARLDRAPLSSREDATLKAWLAQDVRHRGAFMRARTIWLSAGRVAAFQRAALPAEPPASAFLSRRAFGRLAIAAGLAAAAVIPGKPAEASRIYQARSGLLHVQEPLCGDLILDQGTVLRVRRGPGAPCLDLLRGQAHLTARKAPVRLNMDGLSIDLPDGASLIAHACGVESDALVLGGHILIRCAGEKERRVLHRRDWIRYEHNRISLTVLSDDDLERVTAWSRGLLEFQS
ncbi:FecR/PupR family sigma factor regulator, partial [Gluconobacter aidae]|uniref:FecR/PupR family sigma factor regulator n=1 Tax=Gluconobacter aidae TaxID=2662454 RepID=UPI0018864441